MTILVRVVVIVVAVLALVLLVGRLLQDDADRLSDRIDEARDALVDARDEEFLACFADDLVYRRTRDKGALRADLARWHGSGRAGVRITDRRVAVEGDRATARLRVFVGFATSGVAVTVDLEFLRTDDRWLATAFDWRR